MTVKISFKHTTGFLTQPVTAMQFPAGEVHLKGFDSLVRENYKYAVIDARFSPESLNTDVMTIVTIADALSDTVWHDLPVYLILPYLPAARADRGIPFGAKIYGNLIADGDFSNILILDPHSPVMPDIMQAGYAPDYICEFPFARIIKKEVQSPESTSPALYDGVIAPDAGAKNRASSAARVMGVPVYTAGKTRDFETGELTGFHMEDELPYEGRFLLVDDICDGGGTFVGLAEAIKKSRPDVQLDLWVTHGVFSKGTDHLLNWFGLIHTTNSYQSDTNNIRIVTHNITPYFYAEVENIYNERN